ncbi:hypothetical protein ONZ45_g4867 [Pleurotus djamor]|nr:hypothetical protein ONZ45_g4867 [Pleurotus djamor]
MSSSDYEISDDEGDYYDEDDMMDAQDDDDSDDDVMMASYNEDFNVELKGKQKSYEVDYDSLSQDAVEARMARDVDHICGIFGVEVDKASLLLRYMSWNKERLIEKYMDNADAMLCAAGVQVPEPPAPEPSKSSSGSARRTTRSTTKFLGLGSGSKSSSSSKSSSPTASVPPTPPHMFYLLRRYPRFRDTRFDLRASVLCRMLGGIVVPDAFVMSTLATEEGDPEENKQTQARFKELLVRHFVASNPSLKYCPYPGCTNTVSCPAAATKSSLITMVPTVSCGARGIGNEVMSASQVKESGGNISIHTKEHKFCFGCPIDGDHRPLICSVARMWLKKCRDDSETANWIKSNTKECGLCQSTIEKNGGCNHMTCKKCKHEFCWVCMGPWSEHGTQWYSCNRYDEKAGIEARDAQSRSRASLERYLHYYNRWSNHEQSAKLSVDLYSKTEKKMEEMQVTSSLTWIEVQFMKKAVEEVEKCRMTLKWTYAMAYYLARGNEKELFEDNQRDLERAVEDLSELLESPIDTEAIPQLRQKVTDKTVYVQNRNEIVLEDTAQGFQEGRWKWNVAVDGFDEPEKVEY